MINLKYADYPGNYYGFTLKPGYFYGTTETGVPVATSGWEDSIGNVYIYTLTEGKWSGAWYHPDDEPISVSNLPEISEGKLSFTDWLEEVQGIDWNDWDENYSGSMASEIEEAYERYYHDGLPKFARQIEE